VKPLLKKPIRPAQSKSTQIKLVTLIGEIGLDCNRWDIPEEFVAPANVPSKDLGIVFIDYEGESYPLDRLGLNVGLPADSIEGILLTAAEQYGLNIGDALVIPITNGDGKGISNYSIEDGKTIARFIQGKPELASSYSSFIKG
jgi:hypothetical protein